MQQGSESGHVIMYRFWNFLAKNNSDQEHTQLQKPEPMPPPIAPLAFLVPEPEAETTQGPLQQRGSSTSPNPQTIPQITIQGPSMTPGQSAHTQMEYLDKLEREVVSVAYNLALTKDLQNPYTKIEDAMDSQESPSVAGNPNKIATEDKVTDAGASSSGKALLLEGGFVFQKALELASVTQSNLQKLQSIMAMQGGLVSPMFLHTPLQFTVPHHNPLKSFAPGIFPLGIPGAAQPEDSNGTGTGTVPGPGPGSGSSTGASLKSSTESAWASWHDYVQKMNFGDYDLDDLYYQSGLFNSDGEKKRFGEPTPFEEPNEDSMDTEEMHLEKKFCNFLKFSMVENADKSHHYIKKTSLPSDESKFNRAYSRELRLLQEGLPNGIFVKGYEDRKDLFSALIMGPGGTPYEGGLFVFDIKLPNNYPYRPPLFHFVSFSSDPLNPNLYSSVGTVCVSLLGTWQGLHKCERWCADSSLLQVLISIQGLILVREPYFNEPAFDIERYNPAAAERSRNYNESTVRSMLGVMSSMLDAPPVPWQAEVTALCKQELPRMIARIESWVTHCQIQNTLEHFKKSENEEKIKNPDPEESPNFQVQVELPEFPLLSPSFPGAIKDAMEKFKRAVAPHCDAYVAPSEIQF